MDCFPRRHTHTTTSATTRLLVFLLLGSDIMSCYPSADAFLRCSTSPSPFLRLERRRSMPSREKQEHQRPPPPSSFQVLIAAKAASAFQHVVEYNDFSPTPNPDLDAHGVVSLCMNTLFENKGNGQDENDGVAFLDVCFAFSNDRCRAALGGSIEKFRQYASNPVFGYLVHCAAWETLSIGPIIEGTATRGAMQTVLMAAKGGDNGRNNNDNTDDDAVSSRTFLWTLQKERRPPLQGCWVIHEVLYVKNAYAQTL